MSASANHYAVLGLDRRCTADQVRDAYRILAKLHHPDLNAGSAESVARTQKLNAAYETLSDPQRRRAYDDALSAGKPKATPRAAKVSRNIIEDVQLRIEDFIRGARLEVRVNDPGNPEGPETYPLEVPPETAPGTRFRLRREGTFSGGHVVVRVRARPDFRFKVRGSDLRCDLKIPAKRAAQGGYELVPGPMGSRIRVTIPPGIARGEEVRLEGEGLPNARGGRGDLIVRVMYRPEVTIRRQRG